MVVTSSCKWYFLVLRYLQPLFPNNISREVKSGNYVLVRPTPPLKDPHLVIYSKAMAKDLELEESACQSNEFLRFFSGDIDVIEGVQSWATPYALSIFGDFLNHQQCPFKNGHGYGDGRAISIGEVLLTDGKRWEFQLKGGGTTPFCRGADGKAVLRHYDLNSNGRFVVLILTRTQTLNPIRVLT